MGKNNIPPRLTEEKMQALAVKTVQEFVNACNCKSRDVILEAYAESQETIEALKSGMEAMITIYDAQKARIAELEARTLSVKLPDPSSKAFWGGTGKDETFYPSTYKRWVAEAIEQAGTIAQVAIEVK